MRCAPAACSSSRRWAAILTLIRTRTRTRTLALTATPTRTLTLTLSPARARARAQARSLILPNPDAYQVLPFCAMVYEGVKGKVGAHRAPSRPIRMLSTLRCGMAKLGKEGDRSLNTEPFLDPR